MFPLLLLFLCMMSAQADDANDTQALVAAYDASFGAPACYNLGSSCQTDDSMIVGVGSFETNAPNTIDNCTDNSVAVYQQDEYINRIIVRSKDGLPMAAGGLLQIHATVAIASDVSSRTKTDAQETAHIYFASDSHEGSHPVGVNSSSYFAGAHWKWICTQMADPAVDFMAVFSCDFTIPEGNLGAYQAVRVNYGYGEYALSACTQSPLWGTPYSDVDDLVFRVAQPPSPTTAMPSQSPSVSTAPSFAPSPLDDGDVTSESPTAPVSPDAPTSSPTQDQTNPPTPLASDAPTMMPTPELSTYDIFLPTNDASRVWEWAFPCALAGIGAVLLIV